MVLFIQDDPLIECAYGIFDSWDTYGESFKIGEYRSGLNDSMARNVISSAINKLKKDKFSPWKYTNLKIYNQD